MADLATVQLVDGHSGHGWYYFAGNYTDGGAVGPFDTEVEAEAAARLIYSDVHVCWFARMSEARYD